MQRNNKTGRRGKNIKAQAAIEFLVTYGWAILGVMITVGVLSYFGIFNTQKYVNDVCYFGDQMTCEDYILHQDGWSSLTLRNNFGVPIDVTNVIVKSDYGTIACTGPWSTNIAAGNTFEVNCDMASSALTMNNKIKYSEIITFERTGSSNLHNQTGDVLTVVQKSNTCSDGVQNCHDTGCETDVDCGGTTSCQRCQFNHKCLQNSDCASNKCNLAICQLY